MRTLYVRWLGAFGGRDQHGLDEVLAFERQAARVRACEYLHVSGSRAVSHIRTHAGVGLVYDRQAITKKFPLDVCSFNGNDGGLRIGTVHRAYTGHTEAWIAKGASPVAIVVVDAFHLTASVARRLVDFIKATPSIRAIYNRTGAGYHGVISMSNLLDWFMEHYSMAGRKTRKTQAGMRKSRPRIRRTRRNKSVYGSYMTCRPKGPARRTRRPRRC